MKAKNFLSTDSLPRALLLSVSLAIPTFIIYYPAHTHPFSGLDDYFYIVYNTHLHHGLNWQTIRWSFTTFGMENWIPLTWLAHGLDYQLFGLRPAGHHLVNVLLHTANVVLLFWVLKRATGYVGRSFVVAVLFAVHPVNVEPVVWVAELKTVLSTLFFLLALDAYRRYAYAPRLSNYALVVVLFGLGLLAKPQIITFPFVLLLWDYWPLQRMFSPGPHDASTPTGAIYPARSFAWLLKEKVPLFCVAAVDAAATIKVQYGWKFNPPFPVRLENAVVSYFLYIKKACWPVDLAPEYPHLGKFLTPLEVFGATSFLLIITGLVIAMRRYRYLPVGWFWFFGTMVPTIGLRQVGLQGMADRYAYDSFIGLFMMVCWGVSDWAQRRRLSVAWLASASAVVSLAFMLVTSRQISYWQDEFTLWTHAAKVVKNHWVANENVAAILMGRGKPEEAMTYFMRAAEINPTDSFADFQVAVYRQTHGDPRDAIVYYQRALQDYDWNLEPKRKFEIWVNMGVAYRDLGDAANAQRCFHQAAQAQRQLNTPSQ